MRALALAALAFVIACAHPGQQPVTEALPDARVALVLRDLKGKPLTLGSLRGRVVVLALIYTWADPALVEVPRLEALRTLHSEKDVEIINVVLDEDPRMAQIFAETFEISYTVAVPEDPADLGSLGTISIVPTTFLIDRQGRIAARMDGVWPDDVLEKAVGQLVAGSIANH